MALAFAVLWPIVFGVYIEPRLLPAPNDNDSPSPPFVPAAVTISPGIVLTGNGVAYWNVTPCKAGTAAPGSTWLCAISLYDKVGLVSVDSAQVSGAAEVSVSPPLPTGATRGQTLGIGIVISVPPSGVSSIAPQFIIDSHT